MKRKPHMVYKDKMGFVRLNTWCEEMRHLVYASNNGQGAQGKTKIERGQNIYRYKNILRVWPSCTEVEKAWRQIQGLCSLLIWPFHLWVMAMGLWTQLGRKWNTQQEHHYPQIIRAPTKPGGVLMRKSPNNSHIFHPQSVFLLVILPFDPSCWELSSG